MAWHGMARMAAQPPQHCCDQGMRPSGTAACGAAVPKPAGARRTLQHVAGEQRAAAQVRVRVFLHIAERDALCTTWVKGGRGQALRTVRQAALTGSMAKGLPGRLPSRDPRRPPVPLTVERLRGRGLARVHSLIAVCAR